MNDMSIPPRSRNTTPVLSPSPQRFGFGSRTQGVIDDVEEMIEEMEERARARAAGGGEQSERAVAEQGCGNVREERDEEEWFPPPILATAGGTSPRKRLEKHGRSYSSTSVSSSASQASSYVTPYTTSPPLRSSPSPSSSPSRNRQGKYEVPVRRTSPLKHGFSFTSLEDGDDQVEEKTGQGEGKEVAGKEEKGTKSYPPPRLATAPLPSITSTAESLPLSNTAASQSETYNPTRSEEQETEDNARTPRHNTNRQQQPTQLQQTTPTFSRAWLDPSAWSAKTEDEIHESVSGWGMVKKREMTPVTERTEGDERARSTSCAGMGAGAGVGVGWEERDWTAGKRYSRRDSAISKALPTTPTSSSSTTSMYQGPLLPANTTTATTPTTPKRAPAAAKSLIAFFESGASSTPTKQGPVVDHRAPGFGHGRGMSDHVVPSPRFEAEPQQRSSSPQLGRVMMNPGFTAAHTRAASVPDDVFFWRDGVSKDEEGRNRILRCEGGATGEEEKVVFQHQEEEDREAEVMMEGDRGSDVGTVIYPGDSASEIFASATTPALPVNTRAIGIALHPDLLTAPAAEKIGMGGASGRAKERDVSPLTNVRNVVAAWRGKLATPATPRVYDTPALRMDNAGVVAGFTGGGGEGEREGKDRNVFEEAFFTIRRMSTRRRTGKNRSAEVPENVRVAGEKERSAGVDLGREKPLPALRLSAFAPEDSDTVGRAVRGKLVSQVSEITSEPLRLGELWYLNVHDPLQAYKWIKCDAQLFADRLILTWIPDVGDGSRGIITLDLVHCLEVRSIPSPHHPSAANDIGSIAAKAVPDLSNNLYPFQLGYDDGVERLGSDSARDRVRWVSAIWDVLERMPGELDIDDDAAASSETGSRSTVFQPPEMLPLTRHDTTEMPIRPHLLLPDHRFSRVSDDFYLGDSQTGVLPLKRNSSKQLGRSSGSLLRRVASEADLDLAASAAHETMNVLNARRSPITLGPVVPTSGGSEVSIKARPRMTPLSRLQHSSTNSQYESAFSIAGIGADEGIQASSTRSVISRTMPSSFSSDESSERLPSYSSAITVLRVRELDDRSHISGQPSAYMSAEGLGSSTAGSIAPPRLPPRRDVPPVDSARTPYWPLVEGLPSGAATSVYVTAKAATASSVTSSNATPVGPRPQPRPTPLSMHSDYFTATQGSGTYYTPQSDHPRFSIAPSSVSHAASSVDRLTPSATPTASSKGLSKGTSSRGSKPSESRIPIPSFPSSSTSSSSSSSRTPSTSTSSSSSSATTRPNASHASIVSTASSLSPILLETLVGNEQARISDTRVVTSQLDRIETAVADIGTFLSIPPPALPAKDAALAVSQLSTIPRDHGPPSSPSSSSSSSSSSSDTATRPGTPVEDSRLFRDLASIKQQNSALLAQQQRLQDLVEDGKIGNDRVPTMHRLEDLLLRLLARTGDSEILVQMDRDNVLPAQHRRKVARAPSFTSYSKGSSVSMANSVYSDEDGARAPAPAPSIDSEYERRRLARMSGLPDSLLQNSPRLSEQLDEQWEMQNLPPSSPDVNLEPRSRAMPPHVVTQRVAQPEYDYDSHSISESSTVTTVQPQQAIDSVIGRSDNTPRPIQRPIIISRPLTLETESESTTTSTSPSPPRRRFRPGPLPQPVGIPSPVRPEGYPSVMPPPLFRPGFRPSRLGGVREPMTTTYFRRGFPPPIPGAPMVGPHMGPFMNGVGPGLPGFGGPFGPNVFPRPGYMPPGAAGGNYGIPRRQFFPPRPPRVDSPTISSSRPYTSSYYSHSDPGSHHTDQELHDAVHHLDQTQHEANEKAEALAEAQGLQTNEIGRYLHQLGSVMDKNRAEQLRELATLHDDIGRIRDVLNHPPPPLPAKSPTRIIVPEPPVQVTVNTESTIPGASRPPSMHPTPQQMQTAVMDITEHSESGESPVVGATLPVVTEKDYQQDVLLSDLQNKVADLVRRLAESEGQHQQPVGKIVIKETDYKPLPSQPPVALAPPLPFSPVAQSDFAPHHVHFGPEHVKETTTEIVRGPGGEDVETEVVREYDRSASEVAAGMPPSHETVVETKKTYEIAGPTLHDRASSHPPHATTVEDEMLYDPGNAYPASHAPPSTAAPSVIHLKDSNGRPVTILGDAQTHAPTPVTAPSNVIHLKDTHGRPVTIVGDAPNHTAPPTVLGVSDLHNRPTSIAGDRPTSLVQDQPNGLLVKPVPSKSTRPAIVRENPVQLSNIPTQPSRPPTVHDLPTSFVSPAPTPVHADPTHPHLRPASTHQTVTPADPHHGTTVMADPVEHHIVQAEDGRHSSGGMAGQNKLRKAPPSVKFQDHADKTPANDPSMHQHGRPMSHAVDDPHVSNMANIPDSHQTPGSSAPHDVHSGPVPHGTEEADKHGKQSKPSRERPATKPGSHVPAVLSTPPLLGQYNVPPSISPPSDAEEFGDVPGSHGQHHQTAGQGSKGNSHANVPSGGEHPNVLKKKPPKAQKAATQHTPSGGPADHVQEDHDDGAHTNVNITLDNSEGKHLHPQDDAPGRPVQPSARKGHPATDHPQASRPGTLNLPGENLHHDHGGSGSNKADKATASPEQLLVEKERLATQAKAKAEQAEHERIERENIQREEEHLAKVSADRHQEQIQALTDLKKVIADHHAKDDKWKMSYADAAKDKETRRKEKTTREKNWQNAFDKLLAEVETDKKWRDTHGKKPGADAVIDFLKKSNEDQTAFLRALASDIMAQNADQHKNTKEATKAMAREQVAFNVAGYLDDFSKSLSSEVRALLKEVGDLRETRRALYYELAELLLLKGRQSAGDLMAVMPWPGPGIGPAKPNPPSAPPKPAPPKQEPKAAAPPAPAPAWQSFNIPPAMNLGGPALIPAAVPTSKPAPPTPGSRPLPVPGN
ncbi:hypothetical protein QFC22_000634 [Naganishia vaughanmartiniae]|uniref:Uncharacterized protein n=1 Tax=Naganishia vaughanmartiniae TaxID=1424756 RepID=A0ACC2XSJ7_9TREE|nr:hypothetical protein QFC22_000634 [Naganishia vaughanmartiniae]